MLNDLFTGNLVRLGNMDSQEMAKASVRWDRDSEFRRLMDDEPAQLYSQKGIQDWIERGQSDDHRDGLQFSIRTLKEDRLVGFVGLYGFNNPHGNAWLGIGIGDRKDWGKGYGSDALNLIVRYGFEELNLYRISLSVFDYNPRAIRAYEKVGFVEEGRLRETLHRDGKRWDTVMMGILREEWQRFRAVQFAGDAQGGV